MNDPKSPSIYNRGLIIFTDYPSHEVELWVLHSPHPDGTWRGAEKCMKSPDSDGPLVFLTRDSAESYLESEGMLDFFKPVKVKIVMPNIGSKP
jgi:hypothetical protein